MVKMKCDGCGEVKPVNMRGFCQDCNAKSLKKAMESKKDVAAAARAIDERKKKMGIRW